MSTSSNIFGQIQKNKISMASTSDVNAKLAALNDQIQTVVKPVLSPASKKKALSSVAEEFTIWKSSSEAIRESTSLESTKGQTITPSTLAREQYFVPGLDHQVNSKRTKIRAGLATIPGREEGLAAVLRTISPQVDELFVYLNGFNEIPACILGYDNLFIVEGPDVGDRGKFIAVDRFDGYYFAIDDDINYPPNYVRRLIDSIERYGRRAVVGWHGSQLKKGFSSYYDQASRRVMTFGGRYDDDHQVHLLGTGCLAFHTDTIDVKFDDFMLPNMADIFFALAGQKQKVPFILSAHRKNEATPIAFEGPDTSISGSSISKTGSRIDVRKETDRLVKSAIPWKFHDAGAPHVREKFSVALIGRTDKKRWKHGGILKSSHLTYDMLQPYGVDLNLVDVETGDVKGLNGRAAQIVIVYPGDPDRPDYLQVEQLVDYHASRGRVVVVNLSLNHVLGRYKFAVDRILSWRSKYEDRVWLMAFTDRARDIPELREVRDFIVTVPKTLEFPDTEVRAFGDTAGIFLGDYGKLCDASLLGFPVEEVIAKLRAALPEAPLYCVRQYRPKEAKDLGLEILPYLKDDFGPLLAKSRLMVSIVKYATFEMVPAELAAMGIPLIYPEMALSLSDYVGLSGKEVRSIQELVESATDLYRDPLLWESLSRSGQLRSQSSQVDLLSAQMYMSLKRLSRHAS